jgi:hypothetical protein
MRLREDSHLDLPQAIEYRSHGDLEIQTRRQVKRHGELPPELAGSLPELIRETGCDDWKLARAPLPRRESTIYFLRSAQFRLPGLVLKIYRKDAVGKNLAKSLHVAATHYHLAATELHAVPEPVAYLAAANALAMEWIHSPVAGSLLKKSFQASHAREALSRRAAEWLHWFHGQSGVEQESFDAGYFTTRLEKTLIRSQEALRRDPFLAKCVQMACRIATDMHGQEIPHAAAHGDFTPFNLFSQGERIIGFDYQIKYRMPVSHDICRFLGYLASARYGLERRAGICEYGCRMCDLESFMAAYPPGRVLLENGLWLRLQFMELTRRSVALNQPAANRGVRPFRALKRAGLRRDLHQIIGSLR